MKKLKIKVDGYIGTWHMLKTRVYNGQNYNLLEHDQYGDRTACIIVNDDYYGELSDVCNGFDDYEEILSNKEIEEAEKLIEYTCFHIDHNQDEFDELCKNEEKLFGK